MNSHTLEHAIERALRPGDFIRRGASRSFLAQLERVRKRIECRVEADPDDASRLFDTFVAACHSKADELDDSYGDFSTFVESLFVGWARADAATGRDAVDFARAVCDWIERDPYGFCSRLERELAPALNEAQCRSLTEEVEARVTASSREQCDASLQEYQRKRWIDVLRHCAIVQNNVRGYLELCGGEPDASDCEAIAGMLERSGDLERAMAWVERGLQLEASRTFRARCALEKRQRELRRRLGRFEEALAEAKASFSKAPNEVDFEAILEFSPGEQRAANRADAVAICADAPLRVALRMLLGLGETARLSILVDAATLEELEELSHTTTEPVAKRLREDSPQLAAKIRLALAQRIVNAGKSKYYGVALRHLEFVRDAYRDAKRTREWELLIEELQRRHRRKVRLFPGLKRLASGGGAAPDSFVERAKVRRLRD